MSAVYIILFWMASVILFAVAQGLCMPAIRRTAPGREANQQAFALHYLLVAAYFLPMFWQLHWFAAFAALAVRFSLFDFLLNRTERNPPFSVGDTAISDRLQRWIATKIKIRVTVLNAASKVVGILGLIIVAIFKILN